jgi:hypothetical protein
MWWCGAQEEYARAVREVVKELLRVHLLPRLLEEGPPAAWIHFAEEAVAFEGQMAEVRHQLLPRGARGAHILASGCRAASEHRGCGPGGSMWPECGGGR